MINFTVHDFLQRAQKLSLLNDIKHKHLHNDSTDNLVFPVHYKHRSNRQSSYTPSSIEIDQIDIEEVITDAYNEATQMLDDLEILNVLKVKHVLGVKPLSEYVFEQLNSTSKMNDYSFDLNNMDDDEFEIADDDDDDKLEGNDTNRDDNDGCSSDDENEENDIQDSINTTKKDFAGMKVFRSVESDIEHSYFKVKVNDDTRYVHKQSACWILTDDKNKLSNDRLLRVTQTNKEQ